MMEAAYKKETVFPYRKQNDMYAMKAAVKTWNILDYSTCKMIRIQDTLHIGGIYISKALLSEAERQANVEILSEPEPIVFAANGQLFIRSM